MTMLAGRVALITGANQGLGLAIAKAYAEAGASLILCARDLAKLEQASEGLRPLLGSDAKLLAQRCDVARCEEVDQMVERALGEFGRIDILVNNAGVYGPLGTIEEIDWKEWEEAIAINLLGLVYMSRAVVPAMKKARYGKMINLSGGGATNPLPRISAYAASKAGVVRFAETLAEELRDWRIDVNAVAPGLLDTRLLEQVLEAGPKKVGAAFHARMVKMSQEGKTTPLETGARLCVWLGSAASDGLTGKLLAAQWDPWPDFEGHRADIDTSDIYTLRRIVPKDRGQDWGEK